MTTQYLDVPPLLLPSSSQISPRSRSRTLSNSSSASPRKAPPKPLDLSPVPFPSSSSSSSKPPRSNPPPYCASPPLVTPSNFLPLSSSPTESSPASSPPLISPTSPTMSDKDEIKPTEDEEVYPHCLATPTQTSHFVLLSDLFETGFEEKFNASSVKIANGAGLESKGGLEKHKKGSELGGERTQEQGAGSRWLSCFACCHVDS
ncbi:uncharacterized protein JCM6883_000401 [Sporobolomyces salmoneus]|uniref:uncharacterized protein n=1 Tax=Sporobolomyces salmoneus TaxID=183962 RepID=UPI00316DE059